MTTLTITRPDDMHLHLRDGPVLASVLPHSAAQDARAIVMPNLRPPVTTAAMAVAYRARILAALPDGADFRPLMTLYKATLPFLLLLILTRLLITYWPPLSLFLPSLLT